ncbi:hypothetical protein AHAS_Ahas10G0134200 [Arachis hypogaea]
MREIYLHIAFYLTGRRFFKFKGFTTKKIFAHNGHKNVVRVTGYMMDEGHRKVFGKKGLVSMVDGYVEGEVHRYMVVLLDYHKEIHHNH